MHLLNPNITIMLNNKNYFYFTAEEDGEEPEKEMGDANAEDIVDEKQWDEDEEEEDKDGEDGKDGKDEEKFEKNSKMQGEALEGEMRTKDQDEEDDGDDKVRMCYSVKFLKRDWKNLFEGDIIACQFSSLC